MLMDLDLKTEGLELVGVPSEINCLPDKRL